MASGSPPACLRQLPPQTCRKAWTHSNDCYRRLATHATSSSALLSAVAVLQPEDVETICNMVSMLTSLHMGYCPRLQVGALVWTPA